MIFYFPFLTRGRGCESFVIDEHIKIRKILREEKKKFFGIKTCIIKFQGPPSYPGYSVYGSIKSYRKSIVNTESISQSLSMAGYQFKSDISLFGSNQVLELSFENKDLVNRLVDKFNIALNLISPTSTKCSIHFFEADNSIGFFHINHHDGEFPYINLNKSNLIKLKEIFFKILTPNPKIDNILKLYILGLHINDSKRDISTRFLVLVIVLESLLLDETDRGELKYQFSLRFAKVIKKYTKKNISTVDLFELGKKFYRIRSEIAHNGESKLLSKEIFEQLINYTRVIILLWLDDQTRFSSKSFDKLVLGK